MATALASERRPTFESAAVANRFEGRRSRAHGCRPRLRNTKRNRIKSQRNLPFGAYAVGASGYGQSISRLQQGSTTAATTLLKVMVDIATPPSTRVRAAEAVLNHAAKAIEIEDIDARLRELEQAAEANKGGRRR